VDGANHNGANDSTPRPATLPIPAMQPTLRLVLIAHHPSPWGVVTAIVRRQDPASVPLCQLCPKAECVTAADGTCLVTADGYVAETEAASFARTGSLAALRASRCGSRPVPRR
jgi:hypothetical protein